MGESEVTSSTLNRTTKATAAATTTTTTTMTNSSSSPSTQNQLNQQVMQDDDSLSNEFRDKIAYGEVKEVEKQLTTKEALNLLLNANISDIKYLAEDQISVRNYSLGYFNSVWLVNVSEKNSNTHNRTFIIKFYGGNKSAPFTKKALFDHGFDRQLENEIAKLTSTMKIGPKVYYANENFRIEQFVKSTNFRFSTFLEPISSDFAKVLARFHCLIEKLEMKKFSGKSIDLFQCTKDKLVNNHKNLRLIFNEAANRQMLVGDEDTLLRELLFLQTLSTHIKLKRVMMHWDLNPMNILIKTNSDVIDSSSELQTLLIDYEFAHPNIRSFDLGSIIHGATLQPLTGLHVSDEQIANCIKILEDNFIKNYYNEYICYSQTAETGDIDSWSNVKLEAIFGACFAWIHYIAVRLEGLFLMCPETAAATVANELEAALRFHRIAKARLLELIPSQLADQ